jgi:hypothetical protein
MEENKFQVFDEKNFEEEKSAFYKNTKDLDNISEESKIFLGKVMDNLYKEKNELAYLIRNNKDNVIKLHIYIKISEMTKPEFILDTFRINCIFLKDLIQYGHDFIPLAIKHNSKFTEFKCDWFSIFCFCICLHMKENKFLQCFYNSCNDETPIEQKICMSTTNKKNDELIKKIRCDFKNVFDLFSNQNSLDQSNQVLKNISQSFRICEGSFLNKAGLLDYYPKDLISFVRDFLKMFPFSKNLLFMTSYIFSEKDFIIKNIKYDIPLIEYKNTEMLFYPYEKIDKNFNTVNIVYLDSPFVILSVERESIFLRSEEHNKKIIFTESITFPSSFRTLFLFSIQCCYMYEYFCFYKNNKDWYILKKEEHKKIGSFKNMINCKYNPEKTGILFFYIEPNDSKNEILMIDEPFFKENLYINIKNNLESESLEKSLVENEIPIIRQMDWNPCDISQRSYSSQDQDPEISQQSYSSGRTNESYRMSDTFQENLKETIPVLTLSKRNILKIKTEFKDIKDFQNIVKNFYKINKRSENQEIINFLKNEDHKFYKIYLLIENKIKIILKCFDNIDEHKNQPNILHIINHKIDSVSQNSNKFFSKFTKIHSDYLSFLKLWNMGQKDDVKFFWKKFVDSNEILIKEREENQKNLINKINPKIISRLTDDQVRWESSESKKRFDINFVNRFEETKDSYLFCLNLLYFTSDLLDVFSFDVEQKRSQKVPLMSISTVKSQQENILSKIFSLVNNKEYSKKDFLVQDFTLYISKDFLENFEKKFSLKNFLMKNELSISYLDSQKNFFLESYKKSKKEIEFFQNFFETKKNETQEYIYKNLVDVESKNGFFQSLKDSQALKKEFDILNFFFDEKNLRISNSSSKQSYWNSYLHENLKKNLNLIVDKFSFEISKENSQLYESDFIFKNCLISFKYIKIAKKCIIDLINLDKEIQDSSGIIKIKEKINSCFEMFKTRVDLFFRQLEEIFGLFLKIYLYFCLTEYYSIIYFNSKQDQVFDDIKNLISKVEIYIISCKKELFDGMSIIDDFYRSNLSILDIKRYDNTFITKLKEYSRKNFETYFTENIQKNFDVNLDYKKIMNLKIENNLNSLLLYKKNEKTKTEKTFKILTNFKIFNKKLDTFLYSANDFTFRPLTMNDIDNTEKIKISLSRLQKKSVIPYQDFINLPIKLEFFFKENDTDLNMINKNKINIDENFLKNFILRLLALSKSKVISIESLKTLDIQEKDRDNLIDELKEFLTLSEDEKVIFSLNQSIYNYFKLVYNFIKMFYDICFTLVYITEKYDHLIISDVKYFDIDILKKEYFDKDKIFVDSIKIIGILYDNFKERFDYFCKDDTLFMSNLTFFKKIKGIGVFLKKKYLSEIFDSINKYKTHFEGLISSYKYKYVSSDGLLDDTKLLIMKYGDIDENEINPGKYRDFVSDLLDKNRNRDYNKEYKRNNDFVFNF